MRKIFAGGFFGQLVSGVIWADSAAFASWGTHQTAIAILIGGGFFIIPLTIVLLRLSGRKGKLSDGNPMDRLIPII